MSPFLLWLGLTALFGVVFIDQLARWTTLLNVPLLKRQAGTALVVGLGALFCCGFCLVALANGLNTAPTLVTMIGAIPGGNVVALLLLALASAYLARRRASWRLDERAVAALVGMHNQEASALFTRLVDRHPQWDAAWYGQAYALLALDQHVRALDACEQALALVSTPGQNRASVLTLRGMILGTMRRDDEALATLERALADVPRDARAWTYTADVLARTGRYEEALEAVAHAEDPHATSTSPSQRTWVAGVAAETLNALGRPQEALEAAERSLAHTPRTYQARACRAQAEALSQLGRSAEAQQAAELGLEAVEHQLAEGAEDQRAWEIKADLLRLLGREAEAAVAATQALALAVG